MSYRNPHERAIPLSVTVEAWLFIASIVVAVLLIETDAIPAMIVAGGNSYVLSSFVAGIFFTSMLTIAPAIIALGELAMHASAWQVALVGGIGSLAGDILIFRFVRSRLVEYVMSIAFSARAQRFGERLQRGPLWWIPVLGGALIIASPLPDEIGLVMLGLSHIRTWQFIPITLVANTLGIYAIAIVAQHLSVDPEHSL